MLPIPIINGIYFNGRDIYIRLDSCAMFESCTRDGDEVTFDVTDGERSNALFHHIVLRSDARAFREKLLNLNRVYVSKLIQTFHDFSENIVGAASPDELRVKAKNVVSQNSRTAPPTNKVKLSDPRILFQKQRTTANSKGADGFRPVAARGEPLDRCSMIRKSVDDDAILNKQTLRSEYSLQQIPENESMADTPTPADRLPVYPRFVDKASHTSMERRLDTDCAYANEKCGSTISTSSPVQEFPRLYGVPMAEPTTEEHREALKSNDHVSSGVPSLYVQQEYRSKDEEISGSLPVQMDHFDVQIWPPSPLYYDDNALDFLHLEDIPQSLTPGYGGTYGQAIIPNDDQIPHKCLDTSAWASGANELAVQDFDYHFNNL
ncbi:hypothetical protein GCK32_001439 [Trichostrongylus colubriformis]|uniref:Uncharacterized protein n=1 Tax=Trichostrongylus colubriformis TaxID=6319 RepID=A0AAN8FV69_TRICO